MQCPTTKPRVGPLPVVSLSLYTFNPCRYSNQPAAGGRALLEGCVVSLSEQEHVLKEAEGCPMAQCVTLCQSCLAGHALWQGCGRSQVSPPSTSA
jgi:hypothetical protein